MRVAGEPLSSLGAGVTLLGAGRPGGLEVPWRVPGSLQTAAWRDRRRRRPGGNRREGILDAIVVEDNRSGERRRLDARALFVFIGVAPYTGWVGEEIAVDDCGFILTGSGAAGSRDRALRDIDRDPLLLETSVPGVFATGDVRSRSIKRLATAVGEGSMAVRLIHEHLERRLG